MQNQMKVFSKEMFKVLIKEADGEIMFDAESVARSLGLCGVSTKFGGKTYTWIRWDRVNEYLGKSMKEEIRKGSLIPEAAVYKLAFKANNEVAEKFQDWLAIEVLPSIRKTGSYSVNPTPKDPEEYTPKYYRGEPVVTVHDIEAKSNVADYTIRYHLRKLIRNVDYYLLEGAELAEFKRQNPSVDKMYSSLLVINRKGFGKLVKLMRSFSTLGSFKHALPAPEPKEGKIKYVNLLDNNEMHARIVNMNRKAHTVLELLEQLMRKNDEDSHLSICKTLEVLTRRMSVDCDFSYIKYDLIER